MQSTSPTYECTSEMLTPGDTWHQIGSPVSDSERCENLSETACDRELDVEFPDIAERIAFDSSCTDSFANDSLKSNGVEPEICGHEVTALFLGRESIHVRGLVRKHAAKLSRKLLKSDSNLERATIFRAAKLISKLLKSGLGRLAAIELVRDALAKREEEAFALGVDPSDPASVELAIFSTLPAPSPRACPMCPVDSSVLPLLLRCSLAILRRLKRREPRWDRDAVSRAFRCLGHVWAGGLRRRRRGRRVPPCPGTSGARTPQSSVASCCEESWPHRPKTTPSPPPL
jgi:hypothetical protein